MSILKTFWEGDSQYSNGFSFLQCMQFFLLAKHLRHFLVICTSDLASELNVCVEGYVGEREESGLTS